MRSFLGHKRTPIGIDIGGRCVKAAQLARGKAGWALKAAAMFAQSALNAPIDRAMVGRLSAVLERQGFRGRSVVLSMPAGKLSAAVLELPPRSSGAPLEQIARAELARTAKLEPNAMSMDFWELPAPARANGGTHVMAVAVAEPEADAILDAFESEGLNVVSLDTQAWALARACAAEAESASGITALLEVGFNAGLLVLAHEGVVLYQRALSECGVSVLHKGVRERLEVDAKLAGYLLEQTVFGGQMDNEEIDSAVRCSIRGVLNRYIEGLVEEMRASISYAGHRYPAWGVEQLLVLGGGASTAELCEQLGGRLGIGVKVVSPSEVVEYPAGLGEICASPALIGAIGLAQYEG